MEDVKRIAQDINARLVGKKLQGSEQTLEKAKVDTIAKVGSDQASLSSKRDLKDKSVKERKDDNDEVVTASRESVSLQAVGQYGDVETNDHEKTVKSIDKKEKHDKDAADIKDRKDSTRRSHSRSPRRTRARQRNRSRSGGRQQTRSGSATRRRNQIQRRRSRSVDTKRKDARRRFRDDQHREDRARSSKHLGRPTKEDKRKGKQLL
jgi:hypothetical protein